jgi:hypothetical protein
LNLAETIGELLVYKLIRECGQIKTFSKLSKNIFAASQWQLQIPLPQA